MRRLSSRLRRFGAEAQRRGRFHRTAKLRRKAAEFGDVVAPHEIVAAEVAGRRRIGGPAGLGNYSRGMHHPRGTRGVAGGDNSNPSCYGLSHSLRS